MGNLAPIPGRVLDRAYLLVVPLPIYVDADGQRWIDRLWLRDLARHMDYLPRLTLTAPKELRRPDNANLVPFRLCEETSLAWVELPYSRSWLGCLMALPKLVATLWRAVGQAEIVHSGVAGWPIPLGWIANPIALLRRRSLVLVVESSFWRVTPGARATWRARLRSGFSEALARAFIARASFSLFTHGAYVQQLALGARGAVHVEPAVWVDEKDLIDIEQAEANWRQKSAAPRAKFLFAGRLEAAKGVDLLLEALAQLDAEGTAVDVDFLGAGALQSAVRDASQRLEHVRIHLFEPLPYGPQLFAFLGNYHALLVPSRSDEQPRIVFDAFSQAVTVLATRTPGLASCVQHDRTGVLVPRDDPAALAEAMASLSRSPARLGELARTARTFVASHTHRGMHNRRRDLLIQHFAGQAGSPGPGAESNFELTPTPPTGGTPRATNGGPSSPKPSPRVRRDDEPNTAFRGERGH